MPKKTKSSKVGNKNIKNINNIYSNNEDIKILNNKTKRNNRKLDKNELLKIEQNNFKNNNLNNNNDNELKENSLEDYKNINAGINSDPKDIEFLKNITEDSYNNFGLDNIFCLFESIIDDVFYLIYSNEKKSIISFNLIDNKKIIEVKNAHNKDITNFRHCLDIINNIDLVISISKDDNNIKLWDANFWICLLNIKNINEKGLLYSACFLEENNQIYIITSNKSFGHSDPIKVFDLKGNKIKEINNFNDKTFVIDSYYDDKLNKNYIITGNVGNVKSYCYDNCKIYHKYGNNKRPHTSIVINHNFKIIKLIESSWDGVIRIWNFHSAELLRRINSSNNKIYGICLWNNKYLFVGCYDKTIKLIDIKIGKVVKNLVGHNYEILTIKKLSHPKYGECIISQSWLKEQLKLWINKK